jgi:hypothetical protein
MKISAQVIYYYANLAAPSIREDVAASQLRISFLSRHIPKRYRPHDPLRFSLSALPYPLDVVAL